MNFTSLHPYVYLATRYPFYKGQSSSPRICYTSSIYLISEGFGTLVSRGEIKRLGPGALVYIPAGQLHEWLADSQEPMVHICCYFDWNYIDRERKFDTACPICYPPQPLLEKLIGPSFPYPLPEITMVESLRVWEDLFQDFYKNANFTNERTFMRSLTIQRNFQTFIDYFLNSQLKEQQIPDRRITHILEVMEHDLLHDIPKKIEVYYKSLRMSRAHFFELFRQSTACSPVQYMQRFRIGRAKEDLLHTTLTITEIAEKYHFSSVHYFSRLFHKVTGQSPARYRSQQTEK